LRIADGRLGEPETNWRARTNPSRYDGASKCGSLIIHSLKPAPHGSFTQMCRTTILLKTFRWDVALRSLWSTKMASNRFGLDIHPTWRAHANQHQHAGIDG
jgi:hypothetical protein